ncbi:MAG: sugar ABC transporter permease [Clostridium sp.]|nr:sugar ABC transporter permease [Clostridium sp.]
MDKGKINRKKTRSLNQKILLFMLLISLAGFAFFYIIPFAVSFYYSVMDNPITKEYCGMDNYRELFRNPYFMKGLKNTAFFMAVSIPLNIVLSLCIALGLRGMRQHSGMFHMFFLIPLAIPSATAAFFWQNFFGLQGTLNKFLAAFHIAGVDWLNGKYSMLVMVLIFIWKNIGYDMTLFLSGLSNIPEQYYEYADVEGAGRWWKLKNITLTYLMPTTFVVIIMTVVNSFKIFKEIYIMTGEYPPDSLYVLQHYMNNMFLSLNYPKLASAAYILTAVMVLFVACIFGAEKKTSANLNYTG